MSVRTFLQIFFILNNFFTVEVFNCNPTQRFTSLVTRLVTRLVNSACELSQGISKFKLNRPRSAIKSGSSNQFNRLAFQTLMNNIYWIFECIFQRRFQRIIPFYERCSYSVLPQRHSNLHAMNNRPWQALRYDYLWNDFPRRYRNNNGDYRLVVTLDAPAVDPGGSPLIVGQWVLAFNFPSLISLRLVLWFDQTFDHSLDAPFTELETRWIEPNAVAMKHGRWMRPVGIRLQLFLSRNWSHTIIIAPISVEVVQLARAWTIRVARCLDLLSLGNQ